MNKNRKINKKKFGISSPALLLFVVLLTIGYIFMVVIFARMSAINIEDIRKEAEAGNELIRTYISIDRVYENGTIKNETMIVIINQWGKTSIIDYFVVEDWNGGIISKGDLNITLGAGEERIFKGNDILNTFGLNNSNYAEDFWFFKDRIRSIDLHTKLGNTFGSAYKHVGEEITITQEHYYINYSLKTITENTTYTSKLHTLIVESHGPFNFGYGGRDDPDYYYVDYYDLNRDLHHENVEYDIINPTHRDGWYIYPADSLITDTVHNDYRTSYGWTTTIWDGAHYYYIQCESVDIYLIKMELWELDRFGNEVKKINEYIPPSTSKGAYSFTFPLFGNYKLKRYFGASIGGYVPPITTVTGTVTRRITTLPQKHFDLNFRRINGKDQTKKVDLYPIQPWYIAYDGYKITSGGEYVDKVYVDTGGSSSIALHIKVRLVFKDDAPSTAEAVVTIYFHEWGEGPV
jgi:hypothetical protein